MVRLARRRLLVESSRSNVRPPSAAPASTACCTPRSRCWPSTRRTSRPAPVRGPATTASPGARTRASHEAAVYVVYEQPCGGRDAGARADEAAGAEAHRRRRRSARSPSSARRSPSPCSTSSRTARPCSTRWPSSRPGSRDLHALAADGAGRDVRARRPSRNLGPRDLLVRRVRLRHALAADHASAGYLGAALAAAGLLAAARRPKLHRVALRRPVVRAGPDHALWVRTGFGVAVLLVLAAGAGVIAVRGSPAVARWALLLLACRRASTRSWTSARCTT